MHAHAREYRQIMNLAIWLAMGISLLAILLTWAVAAVIWLGNEITGD